MWTYGGSVYFTTVIDTTHLSIGVKVVQVYQGLEYFYFTDERGGLWQYKDRGGAVPIVTAYDCGVILDVIMCREKDYYLSTEGLYPVSLSLPTTPLYRTGQVITRTGCIRLPDCCPILLDRNKRLVQSTFSPIWCNNLRLTTSGQVGDNDSRILPLDRGLYGAIQRLKYKLVIKVQRKLTSLFYSSSLNK